MSGVRRRPGAKTKATRKPKAGGSRRAGPGFGARRRLPSKRRPQARKGRWARLKQTARRHPYVFKALRFGLLASIWGTIIFGGAVVYFIAQVPDPILATLDDRPPNVTILATDGTVLAERGLRRGHVRVDSLPPHLLKAVMATEDRRFYHHFGIDPIGLARATYRNVKAGTVVEGGSTITQQLAKNLFLRRCDGRASTRTWPRRKPRSASTVPSVARMVTLGGRSSSVARIGSGTCAMK